MRLWRCHKPGARAVNFGRGTKYPISDAKVNIWLKLASSNMACSWGSPRPTTKTTTRGKSGRGLRLEKLPNIWSSPLIFLQRPRCPLSVSGASCCYRAKQLCQRDIGDRNSVCLSFPSSICHTRALWQKERTYCRCFNKI